MHTEDDPGEGSNSSDQSANMKGVSSAASSPVSEEDERYSEFHYGNAKARSINPFAAPGMQAAAMKPSSFRPDDSFAGPIRPSSSSSSNSSGERAMAARYNGYAHDAAVARSSSSFATDERARYNTFQPNGTGAVARSNGFLASGDRTNMFTDPRIRPAHTQVSLKRVDANQMRVRAARQASYALKSTSIEASNTSNFASLPHVESRGESSGVMFDNRSSECDADDDVSPSGDAEYAFAAAEGVPAPNTQGHRVALHPNQAGHPPPGYYDPYNMAGPGGPSNPNGVYMLSPVMHDPAASSAYYAHSPSATMYMFPFHNSFVGPGAYSSHGMIYPRSAFPGQPMFSRSDSDPPANALSAMDSSGSLST